MIPQLGKIVIEGIMQCVIDGVAMYDGMLWLHATGEVRSTLLVHGRASVTLEGFDNVPIANSIMVLPQMALREGDTLMVILSLKITDMNQRSSSDQPPSWCTWDSTP